MSGFSLFFSFTDLNSKCSKFQCDYMASDWRLPCTTRSTSITNLTLCTPTVKRKWRNKFKLLDLYKQNECLWMENHKDFLNFELKDELWDQVAQEMCCHEKSIPKPDKWRHLVIKWRYNVHLEELHKQKAIHFDTLDELPRRLRYSDRIQFLINHTFDRKKTVQVGPRAVSVKMRKPSYRHLLEPQKCIEYILK